MKNNNQLVVYLDLTSGAAGDMFLTSLVSASGVNPSAFTRNLIQKLNLKKVSPQVRITETSRKHLPCLQLNIKNGEYEFSSVTEIKSLIRKTKFSVYVKTMALKTFDVLAAAEASVHRVKKENVHFHELNSLDTVIDICGTFYAYELMIEKFGGGSVDTVEVLASPLNTGSLATATALILRNRVIFTNPETARYELCTPTGAAILAVLTQKQGVGMPAVRVLSVGYGAGTKDFHHAQANVVKTIVGKLGSQTGNGSAGYITESGLVLLETNIDDLDPRVLPYVMERLFRTGAKDVWFTQVIMKKNRPGIVISSIVDNNILSKAVEVLFYETTTLGVRIMPFT
ncbi:MAG: LarC family nickel insertion protein, partial [Elusimicrobiota bacterium]